MGTWVTCEKQTNPVSSWQFSKATTKYKYRPICKFDTKQYAQSATKMDGWCYSHLDVFSSAFRVTHVPLDVFHHVVLARQLVMVGVMVHHLLVAKPYPTVWVKHGPNVVDRKPPNLPIVAFRTGPTVALEDGYDYAPLNVGFVFDALGFRVDCSWLADFYLVIIVPFIFVVPSCSCLVFIRSCYFQSSSFEGSCRHALQTTARRARPK